MPGEAVVIQHLSHPIGLQASGHPVRELDNHTGRRQPGEWDTIKHPAAVPNPPHSPAGRFEAAEWFGHTCAAVRGGARPVGTVAALPTVQTLVISRS